MVRTLKSICELPSLHRILTILSSSWMRELKSNTVLPRDSGARVPLEVGRMGQSSSGRSVSEASSLSSKFDCLSWYVFTINSQSVVNHSADGKTASLGSHETCLSQANHRDGRIWIKKGSTDLVSKRLKTPALQSWFVEYLANNGINSLLTKRSGCEGTRLENGVRKTGLLWSNSLSTSSSVSRRGRPFKRWRKFSSSMQNCTNRLRSLASLKVVFLIEHGSASIECLVFAR